MLAFNFKDFLPCSENYIIRVYLARQRPSTKLYFKTNCPIRDKGRHAKTANVLDPEGGFLNAETAMQDRIIEDLHTCEPWDDPDGEPGWSVDQNKIEVCRVVNESEDSTPCP